MADAPLRSEPGGERLDSWKEIASYLRRDVRTVQRWEKEEGLPVHRHPHKQRDTVYAHRQEIDAWRLNRRLPLEKERPLPSLRRWWLVFAGAAGAIVAGALWFGLVGKTASSVVEPKLVPLTSYPGAEAWPSFSPDGNQVAFAWKREGRHDSDIYVKVIGSDKTLQLTSTANADADPAWSPDGREIAFYRSRPDGSRGIYVASPLGGPERLITELEGLRWNLNWDLMMHFSHGKISWSPNGKWLAYLDSKGGSGCSQWQRGKSVG